MNMRPVLGPRGHAHREPNRDPRPAPAGYALRIVSSETLFGGDNEIGIEHEGALYRLKITRQGKLILNK